MAFIFAPEIDCYTKREPPTPERDRVGGLENRVGVPGSWFLLIIALPFVFVKCRATATNHIPAIKIVVETKKTSSTKSSFLLLRLQLDFLDARRWLLVF
jgi:hypothetical protein